jgi:hypothetical protein
MVQGGRSALALLVWLAFVTPPQAFAQDPSSAIGRVKVVAGQVTILRGGQATPASVGTVLSAADILRTGADGRVGVTLKDDTRLSLGANTEVALAEFAYAPGSGQLSLVVRIAHGLLSYISGHIAKLAPSAVRLETPSSVIGVRGTHALLKVAAP